MSDIAAVTAGINAAVHELVDADGLIDQLRLLLPLKGTGGPEVATSRPAPGPRMPWDGPAANAYMAIHAWARHADADLGTYVWGRYHRVLGGSDRATRDALLRVTVYCDDSRVPEAEVVRIARALGKLVRAAQGVAGIDLAPPPAASLAQVCPTCGTGELVADVEAGSIGCTGEGCCGASWSRAHWPALMALLRAVA